MIGSSAPQSLELCALAEEKVQALRGSCYSPESMRFSPPVGFFNLQLLLIQGCVCGMVAAQTLPGPELFQARGYVPGNIALPEPGMPFPVERLKDPPIQKLADVPLFPEGPSYRPEDGSYFFAGNIGLTRLDAEGNLQVAVEKPGGGGTHILPDGSFLLVGKSGLRRIYLDGRIALIADGKETGGGNDVTVGIHLEVYFSVPGKGIYRVSPGVNGKVEKVLEKGGNGLDVDPSGRYLYVHGGGVHRYAIESATGPLGEGELVWKSDRELGGRDGCTFDIWGNLYSMHFRTGVITVGDPETKRILGQIRTGVEPAANLCFAGKDLQSLFVAAGAPKFKNCQLLKIDLGITGFPGHVGATEYPVLRMLEETADPAALALVLN